MIFTNPDILVMGSDVEHRIVRKRVGLLEGKEVRVAEELFAGLAVPIVEGGDISHQQHHSTKAIESVWSQKADPLRDLEIREKAGVWNAFTAICQAEVGTSKVAAVQENSPRIELIKPVFVS